MCVLTKCCCCVDLRTGAMVMAILQVLGGLGSFAGQASGGPGMLANGVLALVAGLCLLYGAIKYEPTATLVYLVFQMLSIITVTIVAMLLVLVGTVATVATHHGVNVHNLTYGVNINNPYAGVNVHNPYGVNINNPYGGYNVHNPYGGVNSSNDVPDVATATTIAVDIMAIALACHVLISIYFWVCAFSFYKGLKSGSITPSADFRNLAEYF